MAFVGVIERFQIPQESGGFGSVVKTNYVLINYLSMIRTAVGGHMEGSEGFSSEI